MGLIKKKLVKLGLIATLGFSFVTGVAGCANTDNVDVSGVTGAGSSSGTTDYSEVVEGLVEDVKSMQEDLADLNTKVEEMSASIEELYANDSAIIALLNEKCDSLTSQIESITERVEALEQASSTTNLELEDIKEAITSLEGTYTSLNETVDKINKALGSLGTSGDTSYLTDLIDKWADLGNKLNILKLTSAMVKTYSSGCASTEVRYSSDGGNVYTTYHSNTSGSYVKETWNAKTSKRTDYTYYDHDTDNLYSGDKIYYGSYTDTPDDGYSKYFDCITNAETVTENSTTSYTVSLDGATASVRLSTDGDIEYLSYNETESNDNDYQLWTSSETTIEYSSRVADASTTIPSCLAYTTLNTAMTDTFDDYVETVGTITTSEGTTSNNIVAGPTTSIQIVGEATAEGTLDTTKITGISNYNEGDGTEYISVGNDGATEISKDEYSIVNAPNLGASLLTGFDSGCTWTYDESTGVVSIYDEDEDASYSYKFTIEDGEITAMDMVFTHTESKDVYHYDVTTLTKVEYTALVDTYKAVVEAVKNGTTVSEELGK